MPWNEPGKDQDPWSGKRKSQPSDNIEELKQKLNDKFGGIFKKSSSGDGNSDNDNNKGIWLIVVGLVIFWLYNAMYTINAGEEGVVLRFGKAYETTGPGLHWRIPPIDSVEIVDVAKNRTANDRTTMLTKDENIVDLGVSVQYEINDSKYYLFNVYMIDNLANQKQGTVYQVMRTAIREVVGRNSMDSIIKEGREQIAQDAGKLMQEILNRYDAGIKIIKVNMTYAESPQEVKKAFDDVNMAREDKDRLKNKAETYAKEKVPVARGHAARLLENAKGYKDQVIARAEGDASRFTKLLVEYQKAKQVTRERLYLDTMEEVLSKNNKILIDAKSGNNLLYLPLNQLTGNRTSDINQATVPAAASSLLEQAQRSRQESSNATDQGRQARELIPNQPRTGREFK